MLEDKDLMSLWFAYEKRSTSLNNTRKLIYKYLKAHDSAFSIVSNIYVSPNVCKDMQDKLFGLGLGTTYAQCHRGCLPFTWVFQGQEAQVKLDIRAKAWESADHRTIADQEHEMQEGAATCPTTGSDVHQALANYACGGLMLVFGRDGDHKQEVVAIV